MKNKLLNWVFITVLAVIILTILYYPIFGNHLFLMEHPNWPQSSIRWVIENNVFISASVSLFIGLAGFVTPLIFLILFLYLINIKLPEVREKADWIPFLISLIILFGVYDIYGWLVVRNLVSFFEVKNFDSLVVQTTMVVIMFSYRCCLYFDEITKTLIWKNNNQLIRRTLKEIVFDKALRKYRLYKLSFFGKISLESVVNKYKVLVLDFLAIGSFIAFISIITATGFTPLVIPTTLYILPILAELWLWLGILSFKKTSHKNSEDFNLA